MSLLYIHAPASGVVVFVVVVGVAVVVVHHFQTSSPPKLLGQIKPNLEPPWEGGTKVYINGPGHMTKMAAIPVSSIGVGIEPMTSQAKMAAPRWPRWLQSKPS